MIEKIIDTISVVDGQLRTADGWCWPNPMSNFLGELGVEDGEYPVELQMINTSEAWVPTRLIIHFDRQLDQSA